MGTTGGRTCCASSSISSACCNLRAFKHSSRVFCQGCTSTSQPPCFSNLWRGMHQSSMVVGHSTPNTGTDMSQLTSRGIPVIHPHCQEFLEAWAPSSVEPGGDRWLIRQYHPFYEGAFLVCIPRQGAEKGSEERVWSIRDREKPPTRGVLGAEGLGHRGRTHDEEDPRVCRQALGRPGWDQCCKSHCWGSSQGYQGSSGWSSIVSPVAIVSDLEEPDRYRKGGWIGSWASRDGSLGQGDVCPRSELCKERAYQVISCRRLLLDRRHLPGGGEGANWRQPANRVSTENVIDVDNTTVIETREEEIEDVLPSM